MNFFLFHKVSVFSLLEKGNKGIWQRRMCIVALYIELLNIISSLVAITFVC